MTARTTRDVPSWGWMVGKRFCGRLVTVIDGPLATVKFGEVYEEVLVSDLLCQDYTEREQAYWRAVHG